MPLPKHRKVFTHKQGAVNPYPLRLVIPSDGNEVQYLRHDDKTVTYYYSVSKTKLNRELTLTKDQFEKFMRFATNVAKIKL